MKKKEKNNNLTKLLISVTSIDDRMPSMYGVPQNPYEITQNKFNKATLIVVPIILIIGIMAHFTVKDKKKQKYVYIVLGTILLAMLIALVVVTILKNSWRW